MVSCLLIAAVQAQSGPCKRVKAQPDSWVTLKVNSLVEAAHAAYQSDSALPVYERVIDGIAATIASAGSPKITPSIAVIETSSNSLKPLRLSVSLITNSASSFLTNNTSLRLGSLSAFLNFC